MIRLDEDGNGRREAPPRKSRTSLPVLLTGLFNRRRFVGVDPSTFHPGISDNIRYERLKASPRDPRRGRCLYSGSQDGNGVDPNPEFKTATMSDNTVANVRALARVGQTPPNLHQLSVPIPPKEPSPRLSRTRFPRRNPSRRIAPKPVLDARRNSSRDRCSEGPTPKPEGPRLPVD